VRRELGVPVGIAERIDGRALLMKGDGHTPGIPVLFQTLHAPELAGRNDRAVDRAEAVPSLQSAMGLDDLRQELVHVGNSL